METKVLAVPAHWDDVVFENRNKAYGAYSLRKDYSDRMIVAFGVSIAFIVSLLLFAVFSKNEIVDVPEILKGEHTLIKIDPIVPPKKPEQPRRSTAPVTRNRDLPPIVTSDPVETTPVENTTTDAVTSDAGDENGTDVFTNDGDVGGIVETPVVVEPPKDVLIAEVMPAYDGGMEEMMRFIQRNMRYPASARRQMIEGTVYVSFVVSGTGEVIKVSVLKGIHKDCDAEAMRVIAMMSKWKGGLQNGSPVNVKMVLPIKFNLK